MASPAALSAGPAASLVPTRMATTSTSATPCPLPMATVKRPPRPNTAARPYSEFCTMAVARPEPPMAASVSDMAVRSSMAPPLCTASTMGMAARHSAMATRPMLVRFTTDTGAEPKVTQNVPRMSGRL